MRWKIHASEGEPEIANSFATSTSLIFNRPGFAEIVLDAKMIWKQDGETYVSDFKPQISGLFAFYPVSGKAIFSQFPAGQISHGRRLIRIKSYEFTVKNQHRILNNANDCILAEPLLIISSEISPASHPIQITKVIPEIFQIPGANQLEHIDTFSFLTPMALEADNIALQLGGKLYDTSTPDHPNSFGFATIPSIQVFSENELMELSLNPAEPITTYEGVEASFDAEVVAAAGIGSGHLCATENTLNLLNGYHVSSVDYIHWFETPLGEEGDWKEKATRGLDYSHIFEPIIGPGSYTMNCGFVLKLRESDSGDEVPVYLENAVPVDVLPGLRIFSPINELAYPLNVSLKVKTSFDKEKNIWKNIKWRLNGKEYSHGLDEGPFYIELNRTGKWSLQAELTIKNPQTSENMLLKDRVDFTVNPVEISLTPTRKVLDFSIQKSQELSLNITLNGKKVEKPGKPVEWGQDGLVALVDPIEWFSATEPDSCATVNSDENNLTTEAGFTVTGATTVLATVTVRLTDGENYFRRKHKGFEDEFEEPVFSFPAVRADLWALKSPTWVNTIGKTATRAILETNRLFSIASGKIKFESKEYDWNKDSVFADKIKIPAAIPDVSPLTSINLKIHWSGPEGQSSKDAEFKPWFAKSDKQQIIMHSYIEFDSNGRLEFADLKTDVYVKPLAKVVYAKVTAHPSTVAVGKPAQVSFRFGEINAVAESQTQLKVWNGEYDINLDSVDWSSSGGVISSKEPNIEFSGNNAGRHIIAGKPKFTVKPQDCDPVKMTLDKSEALVKVLGSLVNIKVDNSIPDHLKKIRHAEEPQIDIYEKSGNCIWSRAETQPLVVACNSTITLIPEFEGQKKPKIRDGVSFQWFNSYGLLALSGNTDLDDKIEFPTPTVIDKYVLKLGFDVVGETVEIPQTYTVKTISETLPGKASGTADLIYYVKGIDDSVSALLGFRTTTPDKEMIDTFYNWWWSDANKLSYNKPAWHADTVIHLGGGMCGGLADYFAMCLQCQGIAGIDRFSVSLSDTMLPFQAPAKSLKSPFPKAQEYWGAIVYKDPGLHCRVADMPGPLPRPSSGNTGEHAYTYSKLRFYTAKEYPLPYEVASNTIIIYGGPENQIDENIVCPKVYVFLAPKDGHVIVRYKAEKKSFLYDPSFGEGQHKGELDDFPTVSDDKPTNVVIKHYREKNARKPALWQYFKNSMGWLRGFIPYFSKYSDIPHGLTVFDVPPESVNFLHLSIQTGKDLFPK